MGSARWSIFLPCSSISYHWYSDSGSTSGSASQTFLHVSMCPGRCSGNIDVFFFFFFVLRPPPPTGTRRTLYSKAPTVSLTGKSAAPCVGSQWRCGAARARRLARRHGLSRGGSGGCTCAPPHFVKKAESATLPCCTINTFAVREFKM